MTALMASAMDKLVYMELEEIICKKLSEKLDEKFIHVLFINRDLFHTFEE